MTPGFFLDRIGQKSLAQVLLPGKNGAETGEFVEVSVSLPDSGPMDAATARQVAAALTQAVSLLDGRC